MKAIFLFTIILFTAFSATKGQTSMTLTSQDLANSQTFKTSVGSDRRVVFNELKYLIVSKAGEHYSKTPRTTLTSKAELISLLGNPDFQENPQLLCYYLKTINGDCKLTIGLDDSDLTLYYSIHDCN